MNNNSRLNIYVVFVQEMFTFSCNDKTTIYDLKKGVAKRFEVSFSNLRLTVGQARRRLEVPDSTLIKNSGIEIDETIFINTISNSARGYQSMRFIQVADPNGLTMIRRVIPADNSCLFASIAYALENKNLNASSYLRRIVAGYIASEPTKYNRAVLEKSNEEYQRWILDESNWGGAIEADILSKYYNVEICVINAKRLSSTIFGSDSGYRNRIYLLYSGSHYDVIVRNISEDMEKETDITTFLCDDKYAFDGGMMLARELNYQEESLLTQDYSEYEEKDKYYNKKGINPKKCHQQAKPSKLKRFFKNLFD